VGFGLVMCASHMVGAFDHDRADQEADKDEDDPSLNLVLWLFVLLEPTELSLLDGPPPTPDFPPLPPWLFPPPDFPPLPPWLFPPPDLPPLPPPELPPDLPDLEVPPPDLPLLLLVELLPDQL